MDVAFPRTQGEIRKAASNVEENEAVTVGVATTGEETLICCVHELIFMMVQWNVVGEKITKAFQERNQNAITM